MHDVKDVRCGGEARSDSGVGRKLAAGLLAGATVIGGAAFVFVEHDALRPWPALAAWAAAIAVLLVGARLLESPRRIARLTTWPRTEVALVGTLTLVALVARTVALGDTPANFSGDEGEMGETARDVLAGELDDPFTTAWLGHPTLWFFAQALSLTVFGDDVAGLRMLSAIVGAATVPALYWLARQVAGPFVATLAAFLLMGYHLHVHFSRVGLNNVADPLFVVVAYAAFLSGYAARSPFRLAVAGVALGLAQHHYPGARIAPLVILAVLVHQLVVDRRRLAAAAPGLAVGALGFVLAYGPLVRVPLFHWPDFQARLAVIGIFQSGWFADRLDEGANPAELLWDQTWQSAAVLVANPVRGPHYEPGVPLLDPVSAVLFAIGLAVVLRAWRQPHAALIVAWLLGVILGTALLVTSTQAHHYVSLAPLLCLLVASGLVFVGRLLSAVVPRAASVVPALALLTVAALTAWSVVFYLRDYTPRRTYGWMPTWTATEIADYLVSRPESYVYFFGAPYTYLNNGTIRFVAAPTGTDVLTPLTSEAALPSFPRGRRPVFVFLPQRVSEAAVVRRVYPSGTLRAFRPARGAPPLFFAYEPAPA